MVWEDILKYIYNRTYSIKRRWIMNLKKNSCIECERIWSLLSTTFIFSCLLCNCVKILSEIVIYYTYYHISLYFSNRNSIQCSHSFWVIFIYSKWNDGIIYSDVEYSLSVYEHVYHIRHSISAIQIPNIFSYFNNVWIF